MKEKEKEEEEEYKPDLIICINKGEVVSVKTCNRPYLRYCIMYLDEKQKERDKVYKTDDAFVDHKFISEKIEKELNAKRNNRKTSS